jgi:hypothetical protein
MPIRNRPGFNRTLPPTPQSGGPSLGGLPITPPLGGTGSPVQTGSSNSSMSKPLSEMGKPPSNVGFSGGPTPMPQINPGPLPMPNREPPQFNNDNGKPPNQDPRFLGPPTTPPTGDIRPPNFQGGPIQPPGNNQNIGFQGGPTIAPAPRINPFLGPPVTQGNPNNLDPIQSERMQNDGGLLLNQPPPGYQPPQGTMGGPVSTGSGQARFKRNPFTG